MGSKLRFQYNLNAEEETGGQKLIKLLEASLQLMFFLFPTGSAVYTQKSEISCGESVYL